MTEPKLELINVRKDFDNSTVVAVDGVDLSIKSGETVALLGPSGCGKSTLLNMIVGLESPTSGDILIDGKSVINLPAGQRNVGLVFQDYAVFTHMTVAQNLAFGLEVRGATQSQIKHAVAEIAELLGMRDQLNSRTKDLGGSELQRVAIGRTLVTKPAVLLLDEPLSNLEAAARLSMRRELRRLQGEIGLTIVYVTHDQVEALSLANRIAVMSSGKIRQVESSADIYERPNHVFVASFLGSPPMNLLRGELITLGADVCFKNGALVLPLPWLNSSKRSNETPSTQVNLGIRPESLRLVGVAQGRWGGLVKLVELRGAEAVVTIELQAAPGIQELKVLVQIAGRPHEGSLVGVEFSADKCLVFSNETGRRMVA
jgi:multiple sugar transport system ATP-binding protein